MRRSSHPQKQAKYRRSFTVYVGGEQVYPRQLADALEADLRSLVDPDGIVAVSRFDTNPANSPQAPR